MDKEIVEYITNHYLSLFTFNEKAALKHLQSTKKLSEYDSDKVGQMTRTFETAGWLQKNKSILRMIEDGEANFLQNVVERIMTESKDKIFFNYCPKCNKLARTPYAKQCRHCGYDWH